MSKDIPHQLTDAQRAIVGLVRDTARETGRRMHEVFSDFLELSVCSLSNAVDRVNFERRESRYMQVVKQYERQQVERFPHMLGHLTLAMEGGFEDVLGSLFMAMEFGDEWRGQFFTPSTVSLFMAHVLMDSVTPEEIQQRGGFLTLLEPACGAGGMVLAAAAALYGKRINPQQHLWVEAIDVALPCAHMTYIQLALHHIPGVVIHGNALSPDEFDRWVTPAHVLGGWDAKLRRRAEEQPSVEPIAMIPLPEAGAVHRPAAAESSHGGRKQMTLF